MQEQLSVWQLVSDASLLVQLVMLILILASIISWAIIVQRARILSAAKRSLNDFEERFWSGMDLAQLYREVSTNPEPDSGMQNIFRAGFKEFSRLRQQPGVDPEAIMVGTQRAMRVACAKEAEKLEETLPFLATVGSTSPYIGLFGTVWGIMNSFRGLATMKQATLAVVAPGISEALIATAIGLFAAIPAVIGYNRFTSQVDDVVGSYETFADEFSAILHRKVHAAQAS